MDPHTDIEFAAPPFEEDPEGLWDMPLLGIERQALFVAFARDDELRDDVENLLRGISVRLRGVFILTFVSRLAVAGSSSKPAGAYLPALDATLVAATDGSGSVAPGRLGHR